MTATLINRAAIEVGGVWKFIPPYGLSIVRRAISTIEAEDMPLATGTNPGVVFTLNRQTGWEFAVSGRYYVTTPGGGLLLQDEIESWFRDSDGHAREVVLCEWVDSEANVKRVWKSCKIVGDVAFGASRFEAWKEFSFALRTGHITPAAAAPDTTTPDSGGPYENSYYDATYTPPAEGDGGGAPEVVVEVANQPYLIPWFFPDIIDAVTGATNVSTRQVKIKISSTVAYSVKSIQATGGGGLPPDGTGASSTVVKVGDADYAAYPTGTFLSLSVPDNVNVAAPVTGTVAIAANGYFYVFITTAAGHQNLHGLIGVEPA